METAIITATAALAGLLLGSYLNRNAEYRRWLRSEQYAACAGFLTEVDQARNTTRHFASGAYLLNEVTGSQGLDPTYADGVREEMATAKLAFTDQILAEREHGSRVVAALQRVHLICPARVVAAGEALVATADELGSVRDWDAWSANDDRYQRAKIVFVAVARKCLLRRYAS